MTDPLAALLAAVEAKLRQADAWRADLGAEWTDQDEALLDAWRAARGEAGMGPWEWWAKPAAHAGSFDWSVCADTREVALAQARDEFPGAAIDLIEARLWSDDINAGEEVPFAATRHAETVLPTIAGDPPCTNS